MRQVLIRTGPGVPGTSSRRTAGPSAVVRVVDLARSADAVTAAAASLSPAELARADAGTSDVRRRRVLLRSALRGLLGEALGVDPRDIPLATRPGRPELEVTAGRPDLDMSCSASGDVGLVAVVSGARVGVDIQQVLAEDLGSASAEGWLADRERTTIARLPAVDQPRALARAWVQKEAVLKGQGVGLWADLARTVTPMADIGRIGAWSLTPVDVPSGFVACVARKPASLRARIHPPRLSVR